MKKKQKTISIRLLSACLVVFAVTAMALSVMENRRVSFYIQRQVDILTNQRACEEQGQVLSDASDYLTEQVYHFAVTRDTQYLQNYWHEVTITQRRESALAKLSDLNLTEREAAQIFAARESSDSLSVKETWAMRLIADSIYMEAAQMPPAVAAVSYRNGEELLLPDEKWQAAIEHLFGPHYLNSKNGINHLLATFQADLRERKQAELSEAIVSMQSAQQRVKYYNLLLLTVLLGTVALFYLLVLRPLSRYALEINHLKSSAHTGLHPVGARESVEFALAFNRIYEEYTRGRKMLENEQFRFRVAVENARVIVYEYEIGTDTYTAFGSLDTETGKRLPAERTIPQFAALHIPQLVDPAYHDTVRRLLGSREFNAVDLRVRTDPSTPYLWARITATPIFDERDRVTRLIGKMNNIESEKSKELALDDLKKRDSLTGLYNKEAGTQLARRYMQQRPACQSCGIMLLDMDHFERINQEDGGVFADAILQETAGILRAMTSPDDYQIRLGGDEFMLFVKNCNRARATVLGPKIAKAIQALASSEGSIPRVSASIGMCVTEVTEDYDSLYRCAESALKFVKENRRGTAACYLDASNQLGAQLTQLYPDSHIINAIDRSIEHRSDLTSYALELLEKTKNLDDAVSLLLSRLGRNCDIDRVSIVEISKEYLTAHYAYQWTRVLSDRCTGMSCYLPAEDLRALIASYDDEGLSQFYPVKGLECLGSMLHAAIWNCGSYEGVMILESRRADYQWTAEQRRVLLELSRVISSFILKSKADATSRAKTEFLSRMSHEIRTPMNAISGMTEIALCLLDDKERVRDCLTKIRSSNAYLLSLINDVLDMSRIESGKVEVTPVSINPVQRFHDLAELMRAQAEAKDLRFIVFQDLKDERPILADFLRINQVLINLIGNAVKFTPSKGTVTLRMREVQRTEEALTITLSVSDTGIGIARGSIDRIFHAFEQADKNTAGAFGGTGLGLAISSRLVAMMGSRLEVESELGKGSSFFFTASFPFSSFESVVPDAAPLPPPEYRFEGMRLLLAEDNALNLEIAQTLLEMQGFLIDHAENGKQAVEKFQQHPPHYYDAILMDIRMPIMDGLQATRKIRTLDKPDSRTIPIIAMTANAFDEDMRQSLESGMNGHLSKPIEVDVLLKLLQQSLAPKA